MVSIALISYVKGWNTGVQVWGEPYWVMSYSDGFVRRALLGSVFSFFYGTGNLSRLWSSVLSFHNAVSILIFLILFFWFHVSVRKTNAYALFAIGAVFATAQFLPTLAYNTGYLDAPVYILFVVAAFCVAMGAYLPAVIIGLVGPFIHESFIFLWATLSILLWHDRDISTRWRIAVISAAVLSTAVAFFFHSKAAALAQMNAAPLPKEVAEFMTESTFGRSISDSVAHMAEMFMDYPVNFLCSLLFFGLSSAVMVWTYAAFRSLSLRSTAVLILATVAPAGILALGWDLSRFLVATALAAFVAILFMETSTKREPSRQGLPQYALWTAWGVAAVFLCLPLVYTYLDVGIVYDPEFFPIAKTPLAEQLRWLVEGWYSKR